MSSLCLKLAKSLRNVACLELHPSQISLARFKSEKSGDSGKSDKSGKSSKSDKSEKSRKPPPYGRKACILVVDPVCSPESLAKNPECKRLKDAGREKKIANAFKSMWETPDCCKDPCPDVLPRFDELYYRISDKSKRKYQVTWRECPEIKIIPKKVCCFDKLPPIPIKRRKRKSEMKAKTAAKCEPDPSCRATKSKGKCPKVTMRGCKAARDPPKCGKTRIKTICEKVCAPYPSFSECDKPKPKPRKIRECECKELPSMCEVWEILRRAKKGSLNK